jgi:flagellar basal body-associated protein FliL
VKKFDTLISNYLYNNKNLDLEGLGTFTLDENFVLPPDAEKNAFYPLEGINFKHNTRAETTPALLDYLVQQTGKIRSLVTADFSSYLAEIKQFVNIGKPWAIEGIGTLQKNKEGKFELIPGEAMSERISMHYDNDNEEKAEPVRRNRWIVGLLFTVAVVAVVAGLGFGVYVLFIKSQGNTPTEQTAANTSLPDSTEFAPISADTVSRKPDSLNTNGVDTAFNYKAYFMTTKWKERLQKRTDQLAGFGLKTFYDSTIIRDTLRYRMFVYQRIIPPDSIRLVKARDSLSAYFGSSVRLEKIR